MADTPSPDTLTKVYIKIRDRRAELKRLFDKENDDLKAQQDQISAALLEYCKTNEVTSSKTAHGTFTRTLKTKYWTSDWEEMNRFILDNELPEFYTKSLNQNNVREFLTKNPDILIKGLNIDSSYAISVRKPSPSMTKGD